MSHPSYPKCPSGYQEVPQTWKSRAAWGVHGHRQPVSCARATGMLGSLQIGSLILVAERGLWSPTSGRYFWKASSLNSPFRSVSSSPTCRA